MQSFWVELTGTRLIRCVVKPDHVFSLRCFSDTCGRIVGFHEEALLGAQFRLHRFDILVHAKHDFLVVVDDVLKLGVHLTLTELFIFLVVKALHALIVRVANQLRV